MRILDWVYDYVKCNWYCNAKSVKRGWKQVQYLKTISKSMVENFMQLQNQSISALNRIPNLFFLIDGRSEEFYDSKSIRPQNRIWSQQKTARSGFMTMATYVSNVFVASMRINLLLITVIV